MWNAIHCISFIFSAWQAFLVLDVFWDSASSYAPCPYGFTQSFDSTHTVVNIRGIMEANSTPSHGPDQYGSIDVLLVSYCRNHPIKPKCAWNIQSKKCYWISAIHSFMMLGDPTGNYHLLPRRIQATDLVISKQKYYNARSPE